MPPAQTTQFLPATWIWIANVQTETLLCECASRHNSGDACSLTAHCWNISIHSHFSGFTSTQNSIPYSSFKAQKQLDHRHQLLKFLVSLGCHSTGWQYSPSLHDLPSTCLIDWSLDKPITTILTTAWPWAGNDAGTVATTTTSMKQTLMNRLCPTLTVDRPPPPPALSHQTPQQMRQLPPLEETMTQPVTITVPVITWWPLLLQQQQQLYHQSHRIVLFQ